MELPLKFGLQDVYLQNSCWASHSFQEAPILTSLQKSVKSLAHPMYIFYTRFVTKKLSTGKELPWSNCAAQFFAIP